MSARDELLAELRTSAKRIVALQTEKDRLVPLEPLFDPEPIGPDTWEAWEDADDAQREEQRRFRDIVSKLHSVRR
jgi:hypothetical protein